MSVLFGIVYTDQRNIEETELALIERALNYWGADRKATWRSEKVGLGNLLRFNTPESLNEKLPLHSGTTGLTIIADARIDNRENLACMLGIPKAELSDLPDSRLILMAYQKFGRNCTNHLIGDFAFAIWDENEKELFCARDHMGVKPFYYYHNHGRFVFASEKKGILSLTGIDKTIDEGFLYTQFIVPPKQDAVSTLYKYIKRLPPAHTLIVSAVGDISLKKYWTLDTETVLSFKDKQEYYDGLREQLEISVNCRLRSAYPIGSELSGGIDSSLVTCIAHRFLGSEERKIITFSNVPSDEDLDKPNEMPFINEVLAFNGIEDAVFINNTYWEHPLDEADFYLALNDGPESSELLWQFPMKKAAAEKQVRTLLSGFPGDQMVSTRAYNYQQDLLDKQQYLKFLFAPKIAGVPFNKVNSLVPDQVRGIKTRVKNQLGLYNQYLTGAANFYNIPRDFKDEYSMALVSPSMTFREAQCATFLSPHVYSRLEAEMRHGIYFGIETRFPLADIRLAQYFTSMPNELKYGGTLTRPALRNAAKGYLPPVLLDRDDKGGHNAPFLEKWLRIKKEVVAELLAEMSENKFISERAIQQKINEIKNRDKGKWTVEKQIAWRVPSLNMIRWLQKNIDFIE